jgi:hypothetical protein
MYQPRGCEAKRNRASHPGLRSRPSSRNSPRTREFTFAKISTLPSASRKKIESAPARKLSNAKRAVVSVSAASARARMPVERAGQRRAARRRDCARIEREKTVWRIGTSAPSLLRMIFSAASSRTKTGLLTSSGAILSQSPMAFTGRKHTPASPRGSSHRERLRRTFRLESLTRALP